MGTGRRPVRSRNDGPSIPYLLTDPDLSSPPDRVGLHMPRRGGGLDQAVGRRGCAQASPRPAVRDVQTMPAPRQLGQRLGAKAILDCERAGLGETRGEGTREMHVVEHRRVDRLLQVLAMMKMAEQQQQGPLILLV